MTLKGLARPARSSKVVARQDLALVFRETLQALLHEHMLFDAIEAQGGGWPRLRYLGGQLLRPGAPAVLPEDVFGDAEAIGAQTRIEVDVFSVTAQDPAEDFVSQIFRVGAPIMLEIEDQLAAKRPILAFGFTRIAIQQIQKPIISGRPRH